MLSALVFLPRGASRNLLVKELRQLRVRVLEFPDPSRGPLETAGQAFDFVVVGSDAAHATPVRKLLGSKRSRPPVIMVETSSSLHASSAYKDGMWCLHRPVKPCLIRAYVRSIMERKNLADQLAQLSLTAKESEGHSVDDLWFAVFERLKENRRE
jgi:hypothetical protein